MRTIGVEEEMLLVDPRSGQPLGVAGQVVGGHAAAAAAAGGVDDVDRDGSGPGGTLGGELKQQQVETDTRPCLELSVLEQEIRGWRAEAATAARSAGAAVAAVGTSPLPVESRTVPSERYAEMEERFGLTTREQLTCGCHIHVSVDSPAEAVGVLDRIRVWLPSLLALSANSPYWEGGDSGYASFRSQAWLRWPSAGPTEVFGSEEAYSGLVAAMLDSGVLLDKGMVYFDARLSERYPTVEIRIADVCLDPADTVLLAALARGLVETAAQELASGMPAPDVPTALLRLATWQAGRYGTEADLLDPHTSRPRPAAAVLADLVEHAGPALRSSGDGDLVGARLAEVLDRGNGAERQRRVFERTGQLVDVVADAVKVTAGLA